MAATTVGYCGGRAPWPTYGDMGDHTEAVQVQYDPGVTTFDDILKFVLPSGGRNRSQTRQYMTAVWPHTDAQAAAVAAATRDLPEDFLFVEPFSCFYRAEDYHQGRS